MNSKILLLVALLISVTISVESVHLGCFEDKGNRDLLNY